MSLVVSHQDPSTHPSGSGHSQVQKPDDPGSDLQKRDDQGSDLQRKKK